MTKSSAKKVKTKTLPLDLITDALGNVSLPGRATDYARAMSQPTPNAMRCRRGTSTDDLPLPAAPIAWYELGRRPTIQSPKPSRFLAYAAGDYYVQDAGSMLALAAVDADTSSLRGLLVCDLCAAPGGKASALVEAIVEGDATENGENDVGGFVLANETIRSRVGALQLNLARTGSDRFAVSNLDPDSLADLLPGVFDVVLVDAPCSGQAMLARGKQKTSSLSPKQIRHNASRQSRILDAAVRLLREDGRLVYSTCTFAEAENEAQVQRLIDSDSCRPHLMNRLAAYESSSACYRLWPHLHHCDGSFAASMTITSLDRAREHRRRRDSNEKLPVNLSTWYESLDQIRLHLRDSVILAWPRDAPDWVEEVAIAGPEVTHRAGQTWKPSHAAALRRSTRGEPRQFVEVADQTAKAYMRGEPIDCDVHGWCAVRWRGRPLGWVKGNGTHGKNHLPAPARMTGELST